MLANTGRRLDQGDARLDQGQQKIDLSGDKFQAGQDALSGQQDANAGEYADLMGMAGSQPGGLGMLAQQMGQDGQPWHAPMLPADGMQPGQATPQGPGGGASSIPPELFARLHPLEQRKILAETRKQKAAEAAAEKKYEKWQNAADDALMNGRINEKVHAQISDQIAAHAPVGSIARLYAKATTPGFDPGQARAGFVAAGLAPDQADRATQVAGLHAGGVGQVNADRILNPQTPTPIDPQWIQDLNSPDPETRANAGASIANATKHPSAGIITHAANGPHVAPMDLSPTHQLDIALANSQLREAENRLHSLQFDIRTKPDVIEAARTAVNDAYQKRESAYQAAADRQLQPQGAPQPQPGAAVPPPAPGVPQSVAPSGPQALEAARLSALQAFRDKHQRDPNPDDDNDMAEFNTLIP